MFSGDAPSAAIDYFSETPVGRPKTIDFQLRIPPPMLMIGPNKGIFLINDPSGHP